jgi:hypothetical protein
VRNGAGIGAGFGHGCREGRRFGRLVVEIRNGRGLAHSAKDGIEPRECRVERRKSRPRVSRHVPAALDRLFAIAPAIEAAGAPTITEEEILAEVEAVRAARRSRGAGADRS